MVWPEKQLLTSDSRYLHAVGVNFIVKYCCGSLALNRDRQLHLKSYGLNSQVENAL